MENAWGNGWENGDAEPKHNTFALLKNSMDWRKGERLRRVQKTAAENCPKFCKRQGSKIAENSARLKTREIHTLTMLNF